ncbi:MAG: M13 family metallopeptidase [Candidatus Limnocylindria bacterium]
MIASGIRLDHIDRGVGACDDFYRYANGIWLDRTEIPGDEPAWGAFTEIRERTQDALHAIVEEAAAAGAPRGSVVQQVGDFYASGMDDGAIAAAGLAPLQMTLGAIDALSDRGALTTLLAELHSAQAFAGFAFVVLPDQLDSTRNILHLQQGGLGLPDRDHYLKDDERSRVLREGYVAHVARVLALAGMAEPAARDAAAGIMSFEDALARASMSRVDQRDPHRVHNPRALARLADEAPGYDWAGHLARLGLDGAGQLNVRQPGFFAALARAAADAPLEEWRPYLRWHVLRWASPYLPAPFEEAHFAFYGRTLTGVPRQRPRWRRVLEHLEPCLGEALGQLYVAKAFPPDAKARAVQLVADLREALRERIGRLDWMSAPTKEHALRKLDKFGVKVGFPDRWKDYSRLEIDRGPYLGNVMRALRFETARQLAKVGRPVDPVEWRMTPQTVNAYYSAQRNEIVFPAAILQSPFFDFTVDDAANYGGIGLIIGHEMTHGFDDAGSQFDADGNLKNWWLPDDRAAYDARTDLVVKQYDAYEPLPGARINGRLCLGENIADIGGGKIAYAAYQRALARTGRATLDGYAPEQRFFLALAQAWRSKSRDEAMRLRLTIDPHSPARFRVLGPLSNLPEFHEAFGCADGSPMCRPVEVRPAIW